MKKIFILIFMLCMMIIFTACTERGDWHYDDLPGDYSIWRNNSKNISLGRNIKDIGATTIIPTYVSEIAYNDDFIFAKQVSIPEDLNEKIDTSNPDYYILVIENEELFGPYTKDEFIKKCDELEIKDEIKWVVTTHLNKSII